MKILAILLTVTSMQLAARGYSQGISISLRNVNLEKVFSAVEQQSKYRFVYSQEAIALSKPVSIDLKNVSLETVLKSCFADQPLTYSTSDHFIIVKAKPVAVPANVLPPDITGRVMTDKGEPIAGATIAVKGTAVRVLSNTRGEFILHNVSLPCVLVISGAESESMEVTLHQHESGTIILAQKINELD